MKFSVFTPTNDPRWLLDCYRSLVAQTHKQWEWVIVPNGPKKFDVPKEIAEDRRVVVAPSNLKGIGALKRYACTRCSGEVYVELDHDDMLTPDALAVLKDAVDRHGVGFYYSDFVSYYPNGVSEEYSNFHGWRGYEFEFEGKKYQAQKSFEPCARSLSEIYYCPNHVRAWHRDAYYKSGGHDPSLAVGDDHDLVCRTYLADVAFVYVPRCIYLYRRVLDKKSSNTSVSEGGLIAKQQLANMNRYVHALALRWADRSGLLKLDLGGAHNAPPGFTTVDLANCDVVHRIGDAPLPFADNSVGVIRAFDFFEHVPREKFVFAMNDFYRVLAPGGWVLSGTPSSDGRGAFQDPTHVNFMNENSFWYYTNREYAKYVPEIQCRFQGVRVWTEFPSDYNRAHNIPYVFADLVALKGQRAPGPCLI